MQNNSAAARWLRDPLVAFLALGAGLFVIYAALNREEATPIVLRETGRALLVSEWEMLTGRAASEADKARVVQAYFERELLFQEGLRRELYRSDPSVRELIIELMQQQVTGEVPEPSGKDLVNFYTDNIDRYYREATITFEQRVFAEEPEDPRGLLEALDRGTAALGDTPWQGKEFPDYGHSMIRGLFGQSFLAVLQQLPPGIWQGPYESRDGWHFFLVTARTSSRLLPFESVVDQVKADFQTAAVSSAVSSFVDQRRARYELVDEVIDEP